MPSPSGFVDFNDYAALNQDEESRLMEEAMARAEAADATASQGLMQANVEAAGKPLSQTGSYSDYLKQKQDAAKAWAAVSAKGADPRSNALRGKVRGEGGFDGAADFGAREDEFGRQRAGRVKDGAWVGAINADHAKRQAEATEAQKAAVAATENHRQTVYGKWMEANYAGGGTSDRDRYAQMLSGAVDQGWALPGRTAEQKSTSGRGDRRGWAIEQQAWGTPSKSFGRPTTKKGTAY